MPAGINIDHETPEGLFFHLENAFLLYKHYPADGTCPHRDFFVARLMYQQLSQVLPKTVVCCTLYISDIYMYM